VLKPVFLFLLLQQIVAIHIKYMPAERKMWEHGPGLNCPYHSFCRHRLSTLHLVQDLNAPDSALEDDHLLGTHLDEQLVRIVPSQDAGE